MGEFRTINGSGNNGDQGEANVQLIRLFDSAFEDGIEVPRGGEFPVSSLPNPRTISNTVVDQNNDVTNFLNASDWIWQWGQVLDHDFALNEDNPEQEEQGEGRRGEFTPIVVPDGDPNFDDGTIFPFTRVPNVAPDGEERQINNQITAFIDGSLVYGSEEERAEFLRDFESGKGLLKTTVGDNGEILLPLNPVDDPFPNAEGGVLGEFQFIGGDIRVNEQNGLSASHLLLVRQHNSIAEDLHERLEAGEEALVEKYDEFATEYLVEYEDASDEEVKDEFLYESARKVLGAQIQIISYEEFVPLLIGDSLEAYEGYKADVSPQISVEFANAAFRLGHTLLSEQLRRVDGNGVTESSLEANFFNPEDIQENGVDTLLTGLIFQGAQEVDNTIVDSVRDFLFPAGQGGLDLASVNIARGREVGVAGYTEILAQIGGPEITNFDELRASGLFSNDVVNLFEEAYATVDQIDLWLGGISELPGGFAEDGSFEEHGGLLGPTLSFFVADQFARSRDGDEFFYLNDLEHLEILDPDIEDTTLADIIRNNVADPYLIPDNAFEVPFENSIFGDSSNNILRGSSLSDLIDGQSGNDYIKGRGDDDILFGGVGDDIVFGQVGDDKVLGGDGNDDLLGNGGDDYINGGAGNDTIRGGGGSDAIKGGVGNDVLTGHNGADTFLFGADLLDGVDDADIISDFEGRDILDFGDYLGAGGTIDSFEDFGTFLQINLSGEDTVNVIGESAGAIASAVDQISGFID